MLAWDHRQSTVSLLGALLVAIILSIVLHNLRFPPAGIIVALPVPFLFYYANMRTYLRRKKWMKQPFPTPWQDLLKGEVNYYRRLPPSEKKRFEQNVIFFLKENRITGIDTEIDDRIRLIVASSAVILIFGRPGWEYRKVPEILIYPRSFDEEYSVTSHPRKRTLSGIVVPQNAMVLSKPELLQAFRDPAEPHHVGLHEFAHVLDLADGYAEGIPGDLDPKMVEEWNRLMQQELRLVRQHHSILNPYAGKNLGELFAVAVEYFFQRPVELRQQHNQLYQALATFFNQDPAMLLSQMETDVSEPYQ